MDDISAFFVSAIIYDDRDTIMRFLNSGCMPLKKGIKVRFLPYRDYLALKDQIDDFCNADADDADWNRAISFALGLTHYEIAEMMIQCSLIFPEEIAFHHRVLSRIWQFLPQEFVKRYAIYFSLDVINEMKDNMTVKLNSNHHTALIAAYVDGVLRHAYNEEMYSDMIWTYNAMYIDGSTRDLTNKFIRDIHQGHHDQKLIDRVLKLNNSVLPYFLELCVLFDNFELFTRLLQWYRGNKLAIYVNSYGVSKYAQYLNERGFISGLKLGEYMDFYDQDIPFDVNYALSDDRDVSLLWYMIDRGYWDDAVVAKFSRSSQIIAQHMREKYLVLRENYSDIDLIESHGDWNTALSILEHSDYKYY